MPLDYDQVRKMHDTLYKAGVTQKSMPEWAAEQNARTGTNLYDQGLHDGWWTRASHWADQNVFKPVADVSTAPAMEAVGEMFGQGPAGRRVGEGLPRAILQTLPLYLAGPEAGVPATIAALGSTGGLMAAETYANTGSGKQALISGVTGAALPGIAKFSGNVAARAFGVGERVAGEVAAGTDGARKVIDDVFPIAGKEAAFKVARYGGAQAGLAAGIEASQYASAKASGQPFDPLNPELLLSQIPFTALDVYHQVRAGKIPTSAEMRARLVKPEVKTEAPYVPPPGTEEQHAVVEKVLADLDALPETATPEERTTALSRAINVVEDPKTVLQESRKAAFDKVNPPLPVQETPGRLIRGPGTHALANAPVGEGDVVGDFNIQQRDALSQMVGPEKALSIGTNVPKSGDPILNQIRGAIHVDPQGRLLRLGTTDVAANEVMDEARFVKATGLKQSVVDAMKLHYPEAFVEGKVNAGVLLRAAQEKPMVEVKTLGQTSELPQQRQRINEITHELDTKGYRLETGYNDQTGQYTNEWEVQDRNGQIPKEYPEDVQKLIEELKTLPRLTTDSGQLQGEAQYAFLSDKPEGEMQKYSEDLYRIPATPSGKTAEAISKGEHQPVLHTSPHFGAEGVNVLGWNRNRQETLPDGSTRTVMIEAQYDWLQQLRDYEERLKQGKDQDEVGFASDHPVPTHPLLKDAGNIVANGVVQKALARGDKSVVVPDAETVMMTEGHDRAAAYRKDFATEKEAREELDRLTKEKYAASLVEEPNGRVGVLWHPQSPESEKPFVERGYRLDVSQSEGMNLHYDQILPDIMRKITGVKGERVDLGLHKMAQPHSPQFTAHGQLDRRLTTNDWIATDANGTFRYDSEAEARAPFELGPNDPLPPGVDIHKVTPEEANEPIGSPVFRNPDGTPRTNGGGLEFSLEKLRGGLSADDTLSLKEAVQKFQNAQAREVVARQRASLPLTDENIPTVIGLDFVQTLRDVVAGKPVPVFHGAAREESVLPEGRYVSLSAKQAARFPFEARGREGTSIVHEGQLSVPDHLIVRQQAKDFLGRIERGELTVADAKAEWDKGLREVQLTEPLEVKVKTALAARIKAGQTTTQAVEAERLRTQLPEIDGALEEQNVAKNAADEVIDGTKKIPWARAQEIGRGRLEEFTKDPKNVEGQKVLALFRKYSELGAHREKISDLLAREVGRSTGNLEKLENKFRQIAEGTDARSRGAGVKNAAGRVVMSREEAEATLTAHPELENTHEVVGTGGGMFKVQEKVRGLDVPLEASGLDQTALQVPMQSAERLPDVTVDAVLRQLDRMAAEVQLSNVTLEEIQTTREFLEARRTGATVTVDPAMKATIRKVMQASGDWREQYNNFSMDSHAPHDPVLAERIGLVQKDGTAHPNMVQNWINWFVNHPDSGAIGQLVKAMVPLVDLKNVSIMHPLREGYDLKQGWTYRKQTTNLPAEINIDFLPTDEAHAMQGALGLSHEIAHHAGVDILGRTDPQAVQLRSTLKQIIDLVQNSRDVPLKVRNAVRQEKSEGWFAKLRTGDLSSSELYDKFLQSVGPENEKWFDVFYGMQNEGEMFAQTFSSGRVVDLLSKIKMKPSEPLTVLQHFSKVWNRLFGGHENNDNALHELLLRYEGYLTGGKGQEGYNANHYLHDAYIGKGVGKPEGFATWFGAMRKFMRTGDLSHIMNGWQHEAENGLLPESVDTPEFVPKGSATMRYPDGTMFTGASHEAALMKADAAGRGEEPAEHGFVTSKGRFVGDNEAHAIKFGAPTVGLDSSDTIRPSAPWFTKLRELFAGDKPTDVYRHLRDEVLLPDVPAHEDLFNRMFESVKIARELSTQMRKGNVPGFITDEMHDAIGKTFPYLNALRQGLDKQRISADRLQNTNNFSPEGYGNLLAKNLVQRAIPTVPDPVPNADLARGLLGLEEVRRKTASDELEGTGQMGRLERALGMIPFMKKKYPAFKDVADSVADSFEKAKRRINVLTLTRAHDRKTGEFSKDVAKSNAKVETTKSLVQAYSNIRRLINEREGAKAQWSWEDKDIKEELGRSGNPDAVKLAVNSGIGVHHVWVNQELPEALTKTNTVNTAKVIASHEVGMLPKQAEALAGQMYDALATMQDPAQSVGGQEILRQLSTQMGPKTFLAALRYSQDIIAATNAHLTTLREHPSFVSEQRYGDHHLIMRGPKGEPFRTSSDSKAELQKIRAAQEVKGFKFLDFVNKSDADSPVGITPEILNSMRELDVQDYNAMAKALEGVDPTVRAKVLPLAMKAQRYEAANNAYRPLPGSKIRHFVAGREYINMMENEREFYVRGNVWLRNREVEARTALHMMHPEVAGDRALTKYSQDYVSAALAPDNPLFRKLNEAVYVFRLGASLGNSLLESVQNLGTGMQSLIAETGSVQDSFKLWAKAIGRIANRTAGDIKYGKGKGSYGDDWIDRHVREADLRGVIHSTDYADIHNEDVGTVGAIHQWSKNPLAKVYDGIQLGARKWTTFFQRYNDRIGFIAGLEVAREKGMDDAAAFAFARDLKDRGYYTGGKAQRAVGLWNIKTKPVPQMLSALQTYTFGWFNQMATDYSLGYGKGGAHLSATERSGSRKAFLYGLAAQATLAGALGLPGMGQGMALMKQATGVDMKGKLRATLGKLFDEDEENGGFLTSLAMRGGLAGLSPIDPSNRAAISFPFVGVDPYKGFDIASLFGAPGATTADAVQGLLAAAHGDWVGFQKLLPSVLKAPAQLIQGEGDVRDARGGLLQTLTPSERFMMAIGLPSSRVQAARDTSEAVKNLNTATVQEQEQLVDKLAQTYRLKGPVAGQQALVDALPDWTEKYQREPTALVQAIATRVRRQVQPYDYRRDLNVGADLAGLGTRIPSNELAGRKLEETVQRDFGLRPRPNFHADRQAAILDDIMNSSNVSKARALQQARETGLIRRPRSGQYIPDYLQPLQEADLGQ